MLSSDIAQICMKLKYINIILIDMGIPLNGQVQATAHNNNHLWPRGSGTANWEIQNMSLEKADMMITNPEVKSSDI